MTDQELLQAIGQVVEAKLDPLSQDIRDLKDGVQKLESRMDKLESRIDQLESRVDSLEETVHGVRVYLDTDQQRTLNLLLEGQQALWDRFVPQEKFEPLKDRTEILELTVRRHSQEIRALQLA